MNITKLAISMVAGAAVVGASFGAQIRAGWRQIAETIQVDAETPVQIDKGVVVNKDGAAVSVGQVEMVDRAIDGIQESELKVTGGTLKLTAGSLTFPDKAPSIVTNDAALWFSVEKNLASTNNGETATEYLTRWCDMRETTTDNPSRWYAEPDWCTNITKAGSASKYGIPPIKDTVWGYPTTYFGGKYSQQCMRLKKTGVSPESDGIVRLVGVCDYFLVFGVTNCMSYPIGTTGDGGGCFFKTDSTTYNAAMLYARGDVGIRGYKGRHTLDGEEFNPFVSAPKRGMQLFCSYAQDSDYTSKVQSLMHGYTTWTPAGGDYLCEVIIFTKRLSDEDRLSIERYLMRKWNLPHIDNNTVARPYQRKYNTIATASGATVEADIDEGEITDMVRFSGNGTIVKKGAGALLIGPSGEKQFAGDVDLQEGEIASRAGNLPAMKLKSGQRLSGYDKNFSPTANPGTREGQAGAATTFSSTMDAGTATTIKDGPAPVRVRSIESGVKTLKINNGQLILDGGEKVSQITPSGDATTISATIPNADFEMPLTKGARTDTNYIGLYYIDSSKDTHGWTGTGTYLSTAKNSAGVNNWSVWCPAACAQGTNCLCLIGTGTASADITIPATGKYQLSMLASQRNRGNNDYYAPITILIDGTRVGSIVASINGGWHRHYFRTPELTAGTHTLKFNPQYYKDDACNIDDIKMDLITESTDSNGIPTAYAIPNGDFELIGAILHPSVPTNTPVNGWTFSEKFVGGYLSAVPVFRGTYSYNVYRPFTLASKVWGSVQVALAANDSWAETTFTPPAGTYKLRGKMALRRQKWGTSQVWNSGAKVEAKVTIGSTSTTLGTLTASSELLTESIWGTAFTVDGTQEVTLRLTQMHSSSAVTLDDFDLIAADEVGNGELIVGSDMEGWNGKWDNVVPPNVTNKCYRHSAGTYSYLNVDKSVAGQTYGYYWGYNQLFGNVYMNIVGDGGLKQKVNLSKAGYYRLTYYEHTRLSGCNGNPIETWVCKEGSTATNFISRSTRYYATNYVEYAYNFYVPQSDVGNHYIALQGMGWNWRKNPDEDIETNLDGASLRYIGDDCLNETPSVPSDIDITMKANTILNLNFPGTLNVGRVRYNGKLVGKKGDVIDKTTHPDFITGMGKLKLTSDLPGFIMLFK